MNLEDIQRHIDKMMHAQNNQGRPDFEGYSPFEMHHILHFTFSLNSPIKFQKLNDSDFTMIPIFNQIKYLTDLIVKNGEIKLTYKGFLPTKIVSELYGQGFIKEDLIESGISKLYKETDSMSIHLTRILIELSGLTKKRNRKLSLTKASEKLLSDNNELLRLIFLSFATRFNWAYFDRYGDNKIGQLGYGFSLILLSKYGNEKRFDTFYSDKYFKAYPQLLESIKPSYGTLERYTADCYSIRTFERFLNYFGLIKIDMEGEVFDSLKYITKTDIYDKLIKCTPHNSRYSQ